VKFDSAQSASLPLPLPAVLVDSRKRGSVFDLFPKRLDLGQLGVLHVSWEVTKNRFNRTCEVKSALCSHHRFSEEFKQQVVSGGR